MKASQALEQDTRSKRFERAIGLIWVTQGFVGLLPPKIFSIPRKTSQRLTRRIKIVSLSVSQM